MAKVMCKRCRGEGLIPIPMFTHEIGAVQCPDCKGEGWR